LTVSWQAVADSLLVIQKAQSIGDI
jgi:Dullard-like phosphatase family protein